VIATSSTPDPSELSSCLEDYLETIFELVCERKVARVRDIAEARSVKAASVSPALRRLATLGLIEYQEREYIGLTPLGEVAARRVLARHHVLTNFLGEVLGMPREAASADACAMEHSLSDVGMNYLVRFLEYLRMCPEATEFVTMFHEYGRLDVGLPLGSAPFTKSRSRNPHATQPSIPLTKLRLLHGATVQMVRGQGAVRQRLLDLGLLPGAEIQVLRVAPASGPLWIQLGGTQLSLRHHEAEVVLVAPHRAP
jgi:DtxR family transcriptional regulator, Mn-dependent transcriptional regulator